MHSHHVGGCQLHMWCHHFSEEKKMLLSLPLLRLSNFCSQHKLHLPPPPHKHIPFVCRHTNIFTSKCCVSFSTQAKRLPTLSIQCEIIVRKSIEILHHSVRPDILSDCKVKANGRLGVNYPLNHHSSIARQHLCMWV